MSSLSLNAVTATSAAKSSTSTTATAESQATAALTKISPALAKAHERLVAQYQTASASISQLGQYKAAVSGLSTSAAALAGLGSKTSSSDDIVKMAESFVATYNAAVKQSPTTGGSGQTDAARALAASKRTLSAADASRSQLGKLGFTRQADGTLKLDTAVLQKSLASDAGAATATLAQIGKAMAKRADAELSDTSRLTVASQKSSEKALALREQQSALISAATELAQAQSQSVSSGSWTTQQALRKYSSG